MNHLEPCESLNHLYLPPYSLLTKTEVQVNEVPELESDLRRDITVQVMLSLSPIEVNLGPTITSKMKTSYFLSELKTGVYKVLKFPPTHVCHSNSFSLCI